MDHRNGPRARRNNDRARAAVGVALPSGTSTARRAWCGSLLACALAYVLAVTLLPRPASGDLPLVDMWAGSAVLMMCGVVALAGARRAGSDRTGWRLIGLTPMVNAVSGIVWMGLFDRTELSPADVGFLSFYVVAYLAVLSLVRDRAPVGGVGYWLDGGIAGCGAAAAVAAFVFPLFSNDGVTSSLAAAVNLAYPVADVLLIAVLLAGLAPIGWRPDRPLLIVIGGLGATAFGDVLYLAVPDGGLVIETTTNLLWLVAAVMCGLAPWARRAAARPQRSSGGLSLLLPSLSAVVALVLLVIATERGMSRVVVALASVTLALAGARLLTAFRQLRALAHSRLEARTDELTGLPNRRAFLEFLDRALGAVSAAEPLSVLLLDLDGFKEVNDTLGHHAGDQLLAGVSARLSEVVGTAGTGHRVARLGGDEFAIALVGVHEPEALAVGMRLREAIALPMQISNMAISVGGSIGVSIAPQHGNDVATLLRFADIAMYQAKATRAGVVAYVGSGDDETSRERLELAQQVRHALANGEIVLYYQPKVHLSSGRVAGTEALARWAHPQRGILGPDAFLPLIEQADLTYELTRTVLRIAVAQLAQWQARQIDWSVAVNIAPADLLDESLPTFVSELLANAGVHPGRLALEITEGALVADPVRAARTVRRLRDAGTQISLDDFGVGFSSLVHLRTLEFDELKLDRTLAIDLERDVRGQAIVRAAVGLAEVLRLRLVVEGVESPDALKTLAALGTHYVQGYVFSPPLPPAELELWAAARATGQPSAITAAAG